MSHNNNSSGGTTPDKHRTKWGRDRLPHPAVGGGGFSIWGILKKCFGRELYKIAMPVVFNEPLSFLQRMAESFEYHYLLEEAADEDDPVKRMQLVAAFAVSALSSNLDRLKKPFNPLLGETYELDRSEENNFRVMCEQVSHHPPISALYGEGADGKYLVEGCVNPRLKFWGKSIEIKPEGSFRVRFPERDDEEYIWSNVDCCIHNIILGTLYFEQYGDQIITCDKTELQCRINYKAANGATDLQLHSILGYIINKGGQKLAKISGKWCEEVYTANMSDRESRIIWQADSRPSHSPQYYNFTSFAMALNEMPKDKDSLPSTDCRFRPDVQQLEQGDLDGASDEKHRLEEKQRDARKKKNKSGLPNKPIWFERVSDTHWRYTGGYWDQTSSLSLPNIY